MSVPFFLPAFVLVAGVGAAQTPCPPGDINQHPGAWRLRPFPVAAARFTPPAGSYHRPTADATLDQVLALLRAAYPQPTGTMAYFNKNLTFSTPYRDEPFAYSLSVGFAGFYCSRANTLDELSESGVFINLSVNGFASLLQGVAARSIDTLKGEVRLGGNDAGQYLVAGRRVFRVPVAAGASRGADHYTRHEYSGTGAAPDRQWFVFRKPDAPLFVTLTRREYVPEFRAELEAYTRETLGHMREFARISGDPQAADHEAQFTRRMAAYLQAVDRYLARASEAELNRPVFEPLMLEPADPDNPDVRFFDGDRMMVTFNSGYFDQKLPHHVPQVIVLELAAGTPRDRPWEAHIRERISNHLDFDAVRALIAR